MKRKKFDRVEITEDGAIYPELPEVKDEFAPKRVVFGQKRKDCCHAVDAGFSVHKARQLFTNKETEVKWPLMSCPFDENKPRVNDCKCPSSHLKEGQPCPHFRRKL
jgi:hypothetical protein